MLQCWLKNAALVPPQCMGQMVTEDKAQSTFLMSVAFAVANLGTFLAPVLTVLSRVIMGNNLAGSRFLMSCILAAIMVLVSKFLAREVKV